MATLLVVDQHRNQYYTRSKSQGHARFGSSSLPSRHFKGINCRTFQTGGGSAGILPTPFKNSTSHHVTTKHQSDDKTPTKHSFISPLKTPLTPTLNDNKTFMKNVPTSAPLSIDEKICGKETTFGDPVGNFLLSELWAGPTYSNSPPPSSLPIPKFSVRPKRTVSLDLPRSCPEVEMLKIANSAPSSPRGKGSCSATDFLVNADSATKTLCRILNLNLDDDEYIPFLPLDNASFGRLHLTYPQWSVDHAMPKSRKA